MIRDMESNINATVMRDGKVYLIKQSDLLVGDIVILSGGDSVPADWLVVEANLQAQVDESYLTPDINPVPKKAMMMFEENFEKKSNDNKTSEESYDSPDPFLLASTLVFAGRMKALVWAVGNNTYVRSRNLHSPYYTMMGEYTTVLQSKIDRIVNSIGRYGFIFWVIALLWIIFRLWWMRISEDTSSVFLNNLSFFWALFYSLIYFLVLLLILIPTSLAKAVDCVIVYSINRLSNENVICLTKTAPENMAKINQLWIEKGGWLTSQKMEVLHIDTLDGVHQKLDTIDSIKREIITMNLSINVVHLNSVGRIVKNLNNENKHFGNRMEWAFLEFLTDNGVDYEKIRMDAKEILQTNPSIEARMVMTVIEHPERNGYLRILINGSSDVFLPHWNEVLLNNGEKELFTYSKKEEMKNNLILNYKKKRLRVFALGYKDVKKEDFDQMISDNKKDHEFIEKQYVLVGLIVLDDPPRGQEVTEAISDCKNAGINIKIVTGDSSEAAKAIAKETSILWNFDEIYARNIVLEGPDFRNKIGGIVTHSKKTRWGKDYIK